MKNKCKFVFVCLCFVFLASWGFSFDFGVSLDSSFLVYDTETVPTEKSTMGLSEEVVLWARQKISENICTHKIRISLRSP